MRPLALCVLAAAAGGAAAACGVSGVAAPVAGWEWTADLALDGCTPQSPYYPACTRLSPELYQADASGVSLRVTQRPCFDAYGDNSPACCDGGACAAWAGVRASTAECLAPAEGAVLRVEVATSGAALFEVGPDEAGLRLAVPDTDGVFVNFTLAWDGGGASWSALGLRVSTRPARAGPPLPLVLSARPLNGSAPAIVAVDWPPGIKHTMNTPPAVFSVPAGGVRAGGTLLYTNTLASVTVTSQPPAVGGCSPCTNLPPDAAAPAVVSTHTDARSQSLVFEGDAAMRLRKVTYSPAPQLSPAVPLAAVVTRTAAGSPRGVGVVTCAAGGSAMEAVVLNARLARSLRRRCPSALMSSARRTATQTAGGDEAMLLWTCAEAATACDAWAPGSLPGGCSGGCAPTEVGVTLGPLPDACAPRAARDALLLRPEAWAGLACGDPSPLVPSWLTRAMNVAVGQSPPPPRSPPPVRLPPPPPPAPAAALESNSDADQPAATFLAALASRSTHLDAAALQASLGAQLGTRVSVTVVPATLATAYVRMSQAATLDAAFSIAQATGASSVSADTYSAGLTMFLIPLEDVSKAAVRAALPAGTTVNTENLLQVEVMCACEGGRPSADALRAAFSVVPQLWMVGTLQVVVDRKPAAPAPRWDRWDVVVVVLGAVCALLACVLLVLGLCVGRMQGRPKEAASPWSAAYAPQPAYALPPASDPYKVQVPIQPEAAALGKVVGTRARRIGSAMKIF